MLVAIIGENCVGKSTLAQKINERLNAKIYTGKDYLRLEKNPAMAEKSFKELLSNALLGDNVIYIITEKEHLNLLPKGAFKILLTAKGEVKTPENWEGPCGDGIKEASLSGEDCSGRIAAKGWKADY